MRIRSRVVRRTVPIERTHSHNDEDEGDAESPEHRGCHEDSAPRGIETLGDRHLMIDSGCTTGVHLIYDYCDER